MTPKLNYQELFNITCIHEYFSPKTCDDLIVQPTGETYRLLKNQQLILKNTIEGIKVLTPVNDKGKLKPVFDAADVMSFNVFPSSKEFYSYTDVKGLNKGTLFCFSNEGLKATGKKLTSGEKLGSGSLNGMPCIATIEIHPTKYLLSESAWPKKYSISFSSTSVKWRYYLLANKGVNNVVIDDTQNEVTFKKKDLNNSTSDKIANSLKTTFPDSDVYLFESSKAITGTYQSRKNFQLIRDGHVIMNHMPNPTVRENGIKIINTQN